jgi:hypothetical protein
VRPGAAKLEGSKSVMLLPGTHTIRAREDGYQDCTHSLRVEPGRTEVVAVHLVRNPAERFPAVTATVKTNVEPSRAGVFMDGEYVGHAGEFKGPGRGMEVAPGTHRIKITLPGYQTFETDVNPIANQTVEVKTMLAQINAPLTPPLVKAPASPASPSAESRAKGGPVGQ